VPFPPLEPEPTSVVFPPAENADEDGVVAQGTDFRPGTLLSAYRSGIFPWPHAVHLPGLRGLSKKSVVLWCSPDPRAHFPIDRAPEWSRSLRRTLRNTPFRVSCNEAFREVMQTCRDLREGGTWILPDMIEAYVHLHTLGFAHSVEVWDGPELVGGIYGIAIGKVFAGESMFHRKTDASKIAFATLATSLRHSGYVWFDVQVQNPHLKSLGCEEVPRAKFLEVLEAARQPATALRLR
jgi:leucyl/phenylalanyl-tRNA---protein transferase